MGHPLDWKKAKARRGLGGARGPRHECPVGGCEVQIPAELLMCKPHWFSLPRPLRAEINDAWAAFKREATAETVARLRLAQTAAIDAVNAAVNAKG